MVYEISKSDYFSFLVEQELAPEHAVSLYTTACDVDKYNGQAGNANGSISEREALYALDQYKQEFSAHYDYCHLKQAIVVRFYLGGIPNTLPTKCVLSEETYQRELSDLQKNIYPLLAPEDSLDLLDRFETLCTEAPPDRVDECSVKLKEAYKAFVQAIDNTLFYSSDANERSILIDIRKELSEKLLYDPRFHLFSLDQLEKECEKAIRELSSIEESLTPSMKQEFHDKILRITHQILAQGAEKNPAFEYFFDAAERAFPDIDLGIRDRSCHLEDAILRRLSWDSNNNWNISYEQYLQIRSLAVSYIQNISSYSDKAKMGYNTFYGPVNDVNPTSHTGYMERTDRSLGHQNATTALLSLLTIRKIFLEFPHLQFVIKHAPGIGAITSNPEYGAVMVDSRSRQDIENDMKAFKLVMQHKGSAPVAIMVSTVSYPAIDTVTNRPALLSPEVISFIRSQVGEDALLMGDDLSTPVFDEYYNESFYSARASDDSQVGRAVAYSKRVIDSAQAGCDIHLLYVLNIQDELLDELVKQTEAREIGRDILEKSVRRIMNQKRMMGLTALSDSDIPNMSIRELWAHKLILPTKDMYCESLSAMQIGGLSFEGIDLTQDHLNKVGEGVKGARLDVKPFIANNSPQELPVKKSSSNPLVENEKRLMKDLVEKMESIFTDGMPEDFIAYLLEDLGLK